ncbi:hypothetical protein ACLKA7_006675 [Drosophila subpalustris]
MNRRGGVPTFDPVAKDVLVLKKDTKSARELLIWINDLMDIQLKDLNELKTGEIYCRMVHKIFPHALPISKVIKSNVRHEIERNFSLLQRAFAKLEVKTDIPERDLIEGRAQYKFTNWFYKFYTVNYDLQEELKQLDDDKPESSLSDGAQSGLTYDELALTESIISDEESALSEPPVLKGKQAFLDRLLKDEQDFSQEQVLSEAPLSVAGQALVEPVLSDDEQALSGEERDVKEAALSNAEEAIAEPALLDDKKARMGEMPTRLDDEQALSEEEQPDLHEEPVHSDEKQAHSKLVLSYDKQAFSDKDGDLEYAKQALAERALSDEKPARLDKKSARLDDEQALSKQHPLKEEQLNLHGERPLLEPVLSDAEQALSKPVLSYDKQAFLDKERDLEESAHLDKDPALSEYTLEGEQPDLHEEQPLLEPILSDADQVSDDKHAFSNKEQDLSAPKQVLAAPALSDDKQTRLSEKPARLVEERAVSGPTLLEDKPFFLDLLLARSDKTPVDLAAALRIAVSSPDNESLKPVAKILSLAKNNSNLLERNNSDFRDSTFPCSSDEDEVEDLILKLKCENHALMEKVIQIKNLSFDGTIEGDKVMRKIKRLLLLHLKGRNVLF